MWVASKVSVADFHESLSLGVGLVARVVCGHGWWEGFGVWMLFLSRVMIVRLISEVGL